VAHHTAFILPLAGIQLTYSKGLAVPPFPDVPTVEDAMPTTGSALRRSIPLPRTAPPANAAPPVHRPQTRSVEAALRALPSHGWTAGWVGRRDRALLVLWRHAGLPFTEIADLTVDDIRIQDGVATIARPDGSAVRLEMTADGLLCGPCGLTRWLHAVDLSTLHSDGRVVASVIARAVPLTAHSPHVCQSPTSGAPDTVGLAVFPDNDRWAPSAAALPVQPGPLARPGRPDRLTPGSSPGSSRAPEPDAVTRAAALESRAQALLSESF
jgi:hypothetical protein